MTALAPRSRARRATRRPRIWWSIARAVPVALVAAALGYTAHHAAPLEGHAVGTAVFVLAAATALSVGLAAVIAGRRVGALPDVVVAPRAAASLRHADINDLDFCTALQARTLSHGFFVALGPRFLRSYNATFLDSPHAIALIATLGEHPVGALMGVLDTRAHRRWTVRHRGVRLAVGGIGALLTRPRSALRFARTRIVRYARSWARHRRGGAGTGTGRSAENGEQAVAVLSHVAVLAGARGTGSGGRLVRAFVQAAGRSGAHRVTLVTLEDQRGAAEFYAKLGWERGASRRTPEGDSLLEWSLPLDGDGRPA